MILRTVKLYLLGNFLTVSNNLENLNNALKIFGIDPQSVKFIQVD